jgi:four helix bundle protein
LKIDSEDLYIMENGVAPKSLAFAIKVVGLYKHLIEAKREYVLSKQMLRSGTAIGALIREAEHAQSKPDFLHKMNIALKEANETLYWLILLRQTDYLSKEEFQSSHDGCDELVKMLSSIVKTTKVKLNK